MADFRKQNESGLKKILGRQSPPQWGAGYEPAIKATREEAPSLSRFAEIWSTKLGRYIHCLSTNEEHVLYVILYNPQVFEIQEQRMLPMLPAPHPLAGHPLAANLELKPLPGTVQVAEDLGALDYHPTLTARADQGTEVIPAPWVGDFLIFLQDADQGPYCVNLTIKQSLRDFEVPRVGVTASTDLKRAALRERARHQVEQKMYEQAGIRTVRIAGERLNMVVISNLMQIYGWCKRSHNLSLTEVDVVVDYFNRSLQAEISAAAATYYICRELGFSIVGIKTVMYQAIWARKIRIDLFQTFFFDRPMVPEHKDVLADHAEWFRRV
jgi:hypothetical protein